MRAAVSEPGVFPSSSSVERVSSSSYSPGYLRDEAEPTTRRAAGLDRQAAVRSALNAGAIAAVLCLLPWGFIVAMPMAGYFGVRLYRHRSLPQVLSPRAGFRIGALSGLFGFLIFAVLAVVVTLAAQAEDKLRSAIIEAVQRAQALYPDHRLQWFDYFTTPHGMVVYVILSAVFSWAAFVLLSGLGGAISASFFRKKRTPA
jgi:hypothetical protein